MALIVTTMRLLNALGMAGCADRQQDDAQTVETADGSVLASKPCKQQSTIHMASKGTVAMPTPSTCTPSSTPGIGVIDVSSTPSPGSACRLAIPLPRCGVSRLTPGHWLLQYESAAYDLLDLELLAAFLDSTKVSSYVTGQKNAMLLVKMMRFLHSLDLGFEDICCHLAHASIYFKSIYSACGAAMSSQEIANVLVLLVFLAHSYIEDETCKLHVWHKFLFKGYCKLPTLSKATVQLMKRLGFVLRAPDQDLRLMLTELLQVLPSPSEEKQ
eukprot:TRINITY_DN12195_c0_g1_i2.p1 TRINITY_DN12195_c0_g1~~TRINITY_DN12195_c0_g1_i2.p1  ORF type:complete len:271 (+),score=58.15 TRINITY_DN12195_c0_g1_i2:88-900(+)